MSQPRPIVTQTELFKFVFTILMVVMHGFILLVIVFHFS